MRRVVACTDRWFVANDAEVHVLVHRTAPTLELIALDAVDFAIGVAASSTRATPHAKPNGMPSSNLMTQSTSRYALLCVVDARGLTWFDGDNQVVHRRALASPTAIVGDALAGGWLVAADGDVLQFASPTAAPVLLARDVGLVTRLRRDLDAIYASLENGELVEVRGIRHGATDARARSIAAFAPGFTAFDAGFALFVDDGGGPRRFDDET